VKPFVVKTVLWLVTCVVVFVAGFVVLSALQQRSHRRDAATRVARITPIPPEAEQQALDRTAKRLFAMDDCAGLGVCGGGTFDDPLQTIEKVWSRGQVLYVQVRPAPWNAAAAEHREHAVDQIMAIWVQELLSAGIWRFSDSGNTRIVVLDKQGTMIICGGGKADPHHPSGFYSCRGFAAG
jgi:hypothetical protein